MTINDLVLQIIQMTKAEQYDLAFKVSENIGYSLIPDDAQAVGVPDLKTIHDVIAGHLERNGLTHSCVRQAAADIQKLYASQPSPAATVETKADWCEMGSDGWLTLKHSSAGNGDDLSRRARELADEPVIGAEGRKLLRQMAAEIEDLRHDIDRHIQIATGLLNEPQSVLKPIGDEPKDGTPFLGYLGPLKVPYFVCWWSTKIKDGQPYICILGIGELWDHKLFPTHWAPLPDASQLTRPQDK